MVVRREEYSAFASAFRNRRSPIKKRLGQVVSVDTGSRTCSVIVGADETVYTGVRYYSSFTPLVGADVWIETDGLDMVAVGSIATAETVQETLQQAVIEMPAVSASVKSTAGFDFTVASNWARLPFNTVVADPYEMWNATNNQFVLPYTGFYQVECSVSWSITTAAVYRVTSIVKNTDRMSAVSTRIGDNYTNFHSVSCSFLGAANDTVEVQIWSDVITSDIVAGGSNLPYFFSINYLGSDT